MAVAIGDLAVGGLDPSGLQIREIYARAAPDYAVYRTGRRVTVQFADDAGQATGQRAVIASLGTLRSDINGLINGWRMSHEHRAKARTRLYDRRCADALISAFTGDMAGALYELTSVRNAIINGRTAIARFQYLGTAFAVVTMTYVVLWLTSFPAISASVVTTDNTDDVLIAVAGGSLGAFLSVAMMLKTRTVLPDLQWVSNTCDAVLRMTVGIVAAAIFVCLLQGGFGIQIGGQVASADAHHGWMQFFTLGFLAGFFERLVPDLLDKVASNVRVTPLPDKPPIGAPGTAAPGEQAPVMPPSATVSGGAAAIAEPGDCLCDTPLAPADAVADAALPVATGGVQ